MKTYTFRPFAAAAFLCALLFTACQKENDTPPPDAPRLEPAGFKEHFGQYEYFGFANNIYGNPYKTSYSGLLKPHADGFVRFTIKSPDNLLTLRIFSVSKDSARIFRQDAQDEQTGKIGVYEGGLSIRKGNLYVRFRSFDSYWWTAYTLCRADSRSGSHISRTDYLGTYTASPEYSEIFNIHTLQIEAGAAANAVLLKNVRGRDLTVPGRISGDTLYTEQVPLDTLDNFLSATKSVIRGNVLYLPFVMQGPDYPPHSPSSSAAVKCYKKQ